jgi:hypothetical protein
MGVSNKMTEFYINHTRKVIIRAEKDAGFNITKHLRWALSQYGWSLDDHIEFINSDRITHPYGVDLLIHRKYELTDWTTNLRHFLSMGSREYRDIILVENPLTVEFSGPFGV